MNTYRERLDEIAKLFKEAAERLMILIRETWESIKEHLMNHVTEYLEGNHPVHPAAKHKPFQKAFIKHQVIDRKPAFIRARTSC
ncbi:hypothetical protein [Bacillus massiliglaciei]|uniref:hypothetical protein n=1 Tax=Bacillus massiliglaciei TaxID=1816693 RepID=UPI0018FEB593|nr:hypothetical protein [Bacillus massiliglaciei]